MNVRIKEYRRKGGESMLQKSMKAEFIKTQQQARSDGNSQQKSVTAFAEDEVAEKARTSAVAAGQTAKNVGRTAVQHSPQSADELKRQAQITKAKIDKAKTTAAKKKAAEEAKKNAAVSKQPLSHSAGAATEVGGSPYALQKQDSAKQAYRQKNAAKIGAHQRSPSRARPP